MPPLDYLEKYDVASEASGSILGKAKDFTISVAADFVSTVFNSTAGLFLDNIRTEDVLSRVDKDSLAFFNEHKEGVEAASFLAGVVGPGLAGVKLLNQAKNGVKALGKGGLAADVFTGKKAELYQTELRSMMEAGKYNTPEYMSAMKKMYAAKAGENFIDAFIFEGITVATLNAHPYMEDYMQSPYSQFAMWGALGGGLGSVIAGIGARHAVRQSLGAVNEEAIGKVFTGYKASDLGATSAEEFQRHNINIKNFEGILNEKTENQLTRNLIVDALQAERAAREDAIDVAAGWLKEMKDDEKAALRPLVENIMGDIRFVNVQKLRLPSLVNVTKDSKGALQFDDTTQLLLKDDAGNNTIAFYRPSSGELFDKTGARSAGLAVDIKGFKPGKTNLYQANDDFLIETISRLTPTAKIDAQYIDELNTWSKVQSTDVRNIVIAEADLPRQNAAIRWLSKQPEEIRSKIQFYMKKNEIYDPVPVGNADPTFGSFTTVGEAVLYAGEQGGPFYKALADRIYDSVKDATFTVVQKGQKLTHEYETYVHNKNVRGVQAINPSKNFDGVWVKGETFGAGSQGVNHNTVMHEAVHQATARRINLAFSPEARGTELNKAVMELQQLRTHVYSKISKDIKAGLFPDELVFPSTAAGANLHEFVTWGLTNAHFQDYLRKTAGLFNRTIWDDFVSMVRGILGLEEKHTSALADLLDITNNIIKAPLNKNMIQKEATMYKQSISRTVKKPISADELVNAYHENTTTALKNMIGNSQLPDMSFEEIAAKLNLTKEAAMAVAAGTPINTIPNAFRYTDSALISTEYLNPKNKMIQLSGNPNKLNTAHARAELDNRFSDTSHQQLVQFFTESSRSDMAKTMMSIYTDTNDLQKQATMLASLGGLKQKIGEINNLYIGSPFAQTVDQALRKISEGKFVTYVGKEVQNKQDALIKKHMEPIAIAFAGLRNKDTAIVEAEILRNRLVSLRGWRDIRVDPDTGFGIIVQREKREGGQLVEVPVREKDGSTFYIKQPEVMNAFESMRPLGRELYELHNLHRKIRSQKGLNDLGFYIPPPSLIGKHISYVIDVTGGERTKLLYANSESELRGLEAAYKEQVVASNPQYRIITGHGEDLKKFNQIQQYMDGEPFITFANNEMKHGGSSASAIVKPDARGINEMIEGFEYQIIAGTRKFHSLYLDDVFHKLEFLSDINQKYAEGQPLKGLSRRNAPDAARTVKNTMMGTGNLEQSVIWKNADDLYSQLTQYASDTFANTVSTFRGKVGTSEYFEKLSSDLNQLGIKNPWESYDLYAQSARASSTPNVSKRATSAATGLLATFQLRLADAAFAAVNTLSLPILLHSSLMESLPKTTLANGSQITLPMRIMYDAVRFRFNPEGKQLIKEWDEAGRLGSPTRQYVDLLGKIKSPVITKDASDEVLSAIEGFQKSKAVELLSKPADFTEGLTREIAMLAGYLGAKHAYPGISKTGAEIHAVSMADRAIGNYYSAQRPIMFQGALGSMLGLYQTYLMTFAQSVYRQIENKNFVNLTQTALLQAGLFGTASWPGYSLLSEFVGKHLSNQNYDLQTGVYRAVGDSTAELILYGLPSWIGPSFYTRGDITPRVPTLDNLAIVNTTVGTYNALGRLLTGLTTQPGIEGKLQSMFEALSLQTMSRPLARVSELISGESITSKGQTVANSTEVWTPMGVFSRLMAVRPMEEQITRNAMHLNSYYGAADYDNRQRAVNKLRTAIRAGTLDDDLIDKTAKEYLQKGGKASGWNDVMNTIMVRTEMGTRVDLLRKLEPDSPLRRMIKENF